MPNARVPVGKRRITLGDLLGFPAGTAGRPVPFAVQSPAQREPSVAPSVPSRSSEPVLPLFERLRNAGLIPSEPVPPSKSMFTLGTVLSLFAPPALKGRALSLPAQYWQSQQRQALDPRLLAALLDFASRAEDRALRKELEEQQLAFQKEKAEIEKSLKERELQIEERESEARIQSLYADALLKQKQIEGLDTEIKERLARIPANALQRLSEIFTQVGSADIPDALKPILLGEAETLIAQLGDLSGRDTKPVLEALRSIDPTKLKSLATLKELAELEEIEARTRKLNAEIDYLAKQGKVLESEIALNKARASALVKEAANAEKRLALEWARFEYLKKVDPQRMAVDATRVYADLLSSLTAAEDQFVKLYGESIKETASTESGMREVFFKQVDPQRLPPEARAEYERLQQLRRRVDEFRERFIK